MLYFTPEGQIPAGEGFTLLGWQHLLMLAILGAFTVLSLRWMRRLHTGELNRLLRILGGVMLGLEVLKDFILAVIGAFSVGYLPLHLCSLAMFVCLYYGAHPWSKNCGQILYSVCFPGAMCALLFPDWTMFPILHFQSIHSFECLRNHQTRSDNSNIVSLSEGDTLTQFKGIIIIIIEAFHCKTAQTQIYGAFILNSSLYCSLHLIVVGRIQDHHARNRAHKADILAALMRSAVLTNRDARM